MFSSLNTPQLQNNISLPSTIFPRDDSVSRTSELVTEPSQWKGSKQIFPALKHSFKEIGDLRLSRSNRPSWPNSSTKNEAHLAEIRKKINAEIKKMNNAFQASIPDRQKRIAEIHHESYKDSIGNPAYCSENAALCLYHLLKEKVDSKHIRIIAFEDQNPRNDHIALLYSENMEDISSNEKPSIWIPSKELDNGMSYANFRDFIAKNSNNTLIIDPWADTKMIDFSGSNAATSVFHPKKEQVIADKLSAHLYACNVSAPKRVIIQKS